MTTNPAPLAFSDHPTAQPVAAFADVLVRLGRHAAEMDNHDELWHDDCAYCQTMILLARTVSFGEQLRGEERRRLRK